MQVSSFPSLYYKDRHFTFACMLMSFLWFPTFFSSFYSCSSCFIKVLISVFCQHWRRHVFWCVVENWLSFGLCYIRGWIRGSLKQENIYGRNIRQGPDETLSHFANSLRWSDPFCLKVIGLIEAEEGQWVLGTWVLWGGHTRTSQYSCMFWYGWGHHKIITVQLSKLSFELIGLCNI